MEKRIMKCPYCSTEVKRVGRKIRPVQSILDADKEKVPFFCKECKSIRVNLKALHDYVLIYPIPKGDRWRENGLIIRPDYGEVEYTDYGVILSYGKGFYDRKRFIPTEGLRVGMKVVYDKSVPWEILCRGNDGKNHLVKIMTYQDVKLVPEYELNGQN